MPEPESIPDNAKAVARRLDCDEYRCPDCLAALELHGRGLRCSECATEFPYSKGIIDFRTGQQDYYFNPVPDDQMATIIAGMSEETWATSIRAFLLAMPRYNPDWLDNLVADGRYSWKFQLDLGPDKRVLDLGCGLGNLTSSIAPHVAKVYALDLTVRRLEFSRERFAIFNPDDDIAILAGGDRKHLPFADNTLDCVILSGVLEWVGEGDTSSFEIGGRWERLGRMLRAHFGNTNPRNIQLAFLREIRRVLKPEGQLFIGIENRLNYEYFLGRPDHHSQLKFGSLMPRFIATLYSIACNRVPYRTFTYSLNGYRRLLKEAGFVRHDFWGLSRGYSHLEEIHPAAVDMPELQPPAPSTWRDRIKRHPLFFPAYGIVADNRDERPARLQDAVVARVAEDLADTLGSGSLVLSRFVITPKDKLLVHARLRDTNVIIKLPCNEAAKQGEKTNAAMLTSLHDLSHAGVPIPRPLGQGSLDGVVYFVEEFLPGSPLAMNMKGSGTPDLAGIARLLDSIATLGTTHLRPASLEGAFYESEVNSALRTVSAHLPADLAPHLAGYFSSALRGKEFHFGPCHGDMSVNNILTQDDEVTGLIDWEGGRMNGISILDSLSLILSLRLVQYPAQHMSESVPELAAGRFANSDEESFLTSRYATCGVDHSTHSALVHLTWLRMASQHLRYGLAYDPRALEEFVIKIARRIVDS